MIYQKIIHHKNNLPESGTDNDIGFFSPKMEMTMILTQNGEMKLREGKIFLMCWKYFYHSSSISPFRLVSTWANEQEENVEQMWYVWNQICKKWKCDLQKWKPPGKQFSPGCKRTPRCPWWSWTVNIDSLLLHPNKEGHLGVWQQMKVTTMQRRMRKRFNSRRQRRFEPNL